MLEKELNTPAQLLQQLLALHTTRIEVCGTLLNRQASNGLTDKLQHAKEQSKQFISELMEELTLFGDAVGSEVDHDTEYNRKWTAAKAGTENVDEKASASLFEELEAILNKEYQHTIDESTDLPKTISVLINRQYSALT